MPHSALIGSRSAVDYGPAALHTQSASMIQGVGTGKGSGKVLFLA